MKRFATPSQDEVKDSITAEDINMLMSQPHNLTMSFRVGNVVLTLFKPREIDTNAPKQQQIATFKLQATIIHNRDYLNTVGDAAGMQEIKRVLNAVQTQIIADLPGKELGDDAMILEKDKLTEPAKSWANLSLRTPGLLLRTNAPGETYEPIIAEAISKVMEANRGKAQTFQKKAPAEKAPSLEEALKAVLAKHELAGNEALMTDINTVFSQYRQPVRIRP